MILFSFKVENETFPFFFFYRIEVKKSFKFNLVHSISPPILKSFGQNRVNSHEKCRLEKKWHRYPEPALSVVRKKKENRISRYKDV